MLIENCISLVGLKNQLLNFFVQIEASFMGNSGCFPQGNQAATKALN